MSKSDWSVEFNGLLSSPLGKEMIQELDKRRTTLIKEAEDAKSQEDAYGLLKKAGGVTLAIEHLQFLGIVPADEGSK